MAELPRGVRGHIYTVMITTYFSFFSGGGGGSGAFFSGGKLLPLRYPR